MALNLMSLGAETETHVDGSSTEAGTASAALQAPAALAPPLTAATAAIGEEGRPRALTAPALHRRAELEGSVHPGSTRSTRAADEVPATTDSEGHAVDGSSTAQLRGGESRDKKRVSCNRASVASSVYGFGDDDFDGVQMRQHGRTNDRSSRGEKLCMTRRREETGGKGRGAGVCVSVCLCLCVSPYSCAFLGLIMPC